MNRLELVAFAAFVAGGSMISAYDLPATYDEHRAQLQRASVMGHDIAFIDAGSGPVVVLVHGIPTSSWMFRKVAAGLVERGYRVIAPDLVGFGASQRIRDKHVMTVEAQAQILTALLAEHLGLDRWSQVVHDFGGPITWAMMEDPRCSIDRLVLLDTFAFREGWSPGLNPFSRIGMTLISPKPTRKIAARKTIKGMVAHRDVATDSMLEGYVTPLLDGGWYGYKRLYFTSNRLKKQLPAMQATLGGFDGPVSLIWGGRDPFLKAERQVPMLIDLLALDDADVTILDDVKHLVAEEAPDRVLDAFPAPGR